MCMVVFAATDQPLPTTPPEESFLFQSQPLLAGSEPVLRLFSKPYVYDLTSVGGCACGFAYGLYDLGILSKPDVPDDVKDREKGFYEQSRESVRLLREFLRLAVGMGEAEVYSCWSGDEEAEPETRLDVTLGHFGGDAFNFVEKQLLVVHGK